jgi:BirA family transcriptional regulator, biotin operon repressor / biotin---[acetyl-CoA-carboxylase] ligase
MSQVEHPYAAVERELRGTAFSAIRFVEATGSTNRDAGELLGDERAFGLTIVADYQTEGAGRKGRSWIAPPGTSLLMTTILPRSIPAANLWVVPFGAGICVRRALALSGVRADLQWPNDLLLGDRKIAGILCASRAVGDRGFVAIGVGLNVHRTAEADTLIDPPPAFCDDAANVDRAVLLRDILLNYEIWQDMLDMPPRIARVWERQAGLPGKRYRILKDGETAPVDVTALSLGVAGGLAVQHDDGRRETIALADARALR